MKLIEPTEKIYLLESDNFDFPTLDMMGGDLVAIGGDFHPQRLLNAYQSGIFPWFIDEFGYIHWFCPRKRMVLYPDQFKVSKSLARNIRNKNYTVDSNKNFESVIQSCANIKRKHEDETWISEEFIKGYTNLFSLNIASSIECYDKQRLIGGLYGVSVGNVFCGESMFSKQKDASKIALYTLCKQASANDIALIDCQVYNDHLSSLGAKEIPRSHYLEILQKGKIARTP